MVGNSFYTYPESWEVVKLGAFVESEKGKKPNHQVNEPSELYSLPYVDIEAFEKGIITSWTDGHDCRICYETDFLMVWDGSRSGLVGKGIKGALGSTLVRIKFPSMENQYAFYFLQYKYRQINSRAKGSGTPHVDPDLLWNYEFPIPPLNEQHRIVAKIKELFSELDKGVESLKSAQVQLKVYRQAVLKHAFEGKLTVQWREENNDKHERPEQLLTRIKQERAVRYQRQLQEWKASSAEWHKGGQQGQKPKKPLKPKTLPPLTTANLTGLPILPSCWRWVRIGEIVLVGTGVTPLKSKPEYYVDGDVAWVTSGALNNPFVSCPTGYVTETALNDTNLRVYPPHTLLVALYGEGKTRGKCSELLIEATTNQAIAALVQEGTAEYLRGLLKWFLMKNYDEVRTGSSGGVQPNLNLGIIENSPVPICSIAEAEEIGRQIKRKFSQAVELEEELVACLRQSEVIRQSILKKAFAGQLVPQDPNDEPASILLARIRAERERVVKKNHTKKSKKRKIAV